MTPVQVTMYAANLTGAPAARARRIAAIRSFLGFAAELGVLEGNTIRGLRTPKVPKRIHERLLREDEVRELIAEARCARDRALLRVLYLAGLRVSEVTHIRWRDVGRKWISMVGKGQRSRTVVVPEALVQEIRKLREPRDIDDAFVSKGRSRGPITAGQVRRVVHRFGMEALGKRVSPHFLRH